MNLNMVINMFTRLVMRRAMNWGINKGMGQLSRKSPPQQGEMQDGGHADARPRAGQQNQNSKQAKDAAKRMRTLGRMTRR